jgi:hypothetical protein
VRRGVTKVLVGRGVAGAEAAVVMAGSLMVETEDFEILFLSVTSAMLSSFRAYETISDDEQVNSLYCTGIV